jgi:GntR family transcriptional regulator
MNTALEQSSPLRPTPGTPLYASLAQRLIDEIAAGRFPIGSLLPTELELSEQFSVSRQTVRQALKQLADSGLVSRRPRLGTRVERDKAVARYSMSIDSIADFASYAKQTRLVLDEITPVVARGALAERIGCREGTRWLHLTGARHAGDGTKVAVSETWLRDEFPGIERRLRNVRGVAMTMLLERHYGEHIAEIQQEVCAVPILGRDALVLNVASGTPGLEVHRRFFGRGGRMVITGRVLHPGDRFSYSSRFLRETGGPGETGA